MSWRRMENACVFLTSTTAMMAELVTNWAASAGAVAFRFSPRAGYMFGCILFVRLLQVSSVQNLMIRKVVVSKVANNPH